MCVLSPVRLLFGTLYPAYYSYKAVKTKNVKEYVSSRTITKVRGFKFVLYLFYVLVC